jgi:ATP-binding cassette subfamily F protein 3
MAEEIILRFDEVYFEYQHKKPILDSASFSVRKNSKITLMGQNGAGKSSLFALIKGEIKPKSGHVFISKGASIGMADQVMARADFDLSVEKYLTKAFEVVPANIASRISKALDAVNLSIPTNWRAGDLSGGQQARLLLAYALIQNPDILLLDEPTNNLDQAGIDHLLKFLITYNKTVIVISHDADFLNCFTEGVIYLDVFTHNIETYVGDYYSVVEEIGQRVEREQRKNAQLEKQIKDRKEKVNFFANKGGKMRKLAKKLKDETAELEDNMVEVRKEDKAIRKFNIPAQDITGEIVKINAVKIIRNHKPEIKKLEKIIRQRTHLLVTGPNGIGKSTLLRSLVSGKNEHVEILAGVRIGYYSQDFSNLGFEDTVFASLQSASPDSSDTQIMRSVAAGFLLGGDLMGHKISELSEGQKGLLSFARLVLMRPGLLILDEPTNHINFRHLPVISKAVGEYEGAMIMISHMPDFVKAVRIDDYLDLSII